MYDEHNRLFVASLSSAAHEPHLFVPPHTMPEGQQVSVCPVLASKAQAPYWEQQSSLQGK